jgi:ubiquinone/menaquinone biosynthesis C-methylase UbiE
MNETTLNEAEIQVLASLHKANTENASSDRASLEKEGKRFWIFLEDWADAFPSLLAKGLIEGDDDGYRLSESGRSFGAHYHAERPDMYWYYYQKFYPAARASAAHSRLCERVFGLDLTQEGQADMAALHHLLQLLDVKQGESVLDLGCGAGVIAEYITQKTGTEVTGLDYAAPAIEEARQRTQGQNNKVSFVQGDLNALELTDQSFDAVTSIDTLYWVADLTKTMADLAKLLKPGGRMCIFMMDDVPEGRTAEEFSADETWLGQSLIELGIKHDAYDYTIQHAAFWDRTYKAAKDLKDEFEAEGNGFITASLIRESEEVFLPTIKAGSVVRYLYHIRC